MIRDQHRQRVYDAEGSALGGTTLTEQLPWHDVVATFRTIVHHPWWVATGTPPPGILPARHGARRSSSDGRTVRIAQGGHDALTIAHELAHHLVATAFPDDGPAHGPRFCAALLRLVEVVGGPAARERLHAELRASGVPIAPWWGAEPPRLPPVGDTLVSTCPARLRGAIPLGPVARSAPPGPE